MPIRRGHMVARQNEQDAIDLVQQAPPLSLQKRVVTVYTTLTSSGWTGGDLTTLPPASSTDKSTTDIKTTSSEDDLLQTIKAIGAQKTSTSAASSSLPTAIEASTATQSNVGSTLAMDGADPTSSTLVASPTTAPSSTATSATAASASASSTSSASSESSGSDAAGKAGIALGVLGGLFIVLALVYWMISKRRKQMEEQRRLADDEKLNGPFADGPPPQTPAKAPRLSLRPMTQLFTGFHASNQNDRQVNQESDISMVASPTARRPMTSDSQNEHNPFGNHAQIVEQPVTPKHNPMGPMSPISEASGMPSPESTRGPQPAPRVSAVTTDSATVPSLITKDLPRSPAHSQQVSPIESVEESEVGRALSTPDMTPAPAGVMLSAGAAATATAVERRQSMRQEHVPAPIDLTLPPKLTGAVPPSPAGTEFSMHEVDGDQAPVHSSSAAAIAAAGGPVNTTVHRVQLDFKPTMDDEMELTAGQLVRLLHEYDDGWVRQFLSPTNMSAMSTNFSVGSLHSSRPLPAGCCAANLLVNATRKATRAPPWCSRPARKSPRKTPGSFSQQPTRTWPQLPFWGQAYGPSTPPRAWGAARSRIPATSGPSYGHSYGATGSPTPIPSRPTTSTVTKHGGEKTESPRTYRHATRTPTEP